MQQKATQSIGPLASKVLAGFPFILLSVKSTAPNTSEQLNVTHALVELLRGRSYQEIRQRMYEKPPETAWWAACKTELDIRNSERMAAALLDTSRASDKIRSSTEHIEQLVDTSLQMTQSMADVVNGVRQAGRRLEIATYVIVAVAVLQLFYISFQLMGKH